MSLRKPFVIAAAPGIAAASLIAVVALPTFEPVLACVRADAWPASLLWLHAAADAGIVVAYVWIPLTLLTLWRRRDDIPLSWTLLCVAAFVVLCGATHAMNIATSWRPLYWLAGEIKTATALVSIATAVLLHFVAAPKLLAIPSAKNWHLIEERAREQIRAAEKNAADARSAEHEAKDVSEELRRANEDLRRIQARAAEAEATVRELSTPVLVVAPNVLLAPLVGTMDSLRAAQLMEASLDAVQRHGAAFVIVDVSGVPVVDTAVADSLLKLSAAIGLLGARCVITGIRPAVASTIVALGVDVGSLRTFGSLSQGLAVVFGDSTTTELKAR